MGIPEERKDTFDAVKAIACIAVVLIHYNIKGEIGDVVKSAARFAVPTFFIISGYFLSSAARQIRKLLKLLTWATLFYAVFVFGLEVLRRGGCESVSAAYFCGKYLRAAQVVRFFVSNGTLFAPHLWFVAALIYCYLFTDLILGTKRKRDLACYMIVPLLAVLAVSQEFSRALKIQWHLIPICGVVGKEYISVSALFIVRALPFFLIGVWLRSAAESLTNRFGSGLMWLSVAALGCGLSIGEYYFLEHRVIGFYLGSTLTGVSLALWAKKATVGGRIVRMFAWVGRELSLYIYIFHIAIGRLILYVGERLHCNRALWFELSVFPLVLTGSVLIAIVAREISKRSCS